MEGSIHEEARALLASARALLQELVEEGVEEMPRMLDENLPIGSGVVEASCKTLVTHRLKRSGMNWGEEGGQAILLLRSLILSERFERAWDLLLSTYKRRVRVPEGVLEFPARRASGNVSG